MSTLHSTKFTILDKNKVLRRLEAEITNRNGYPEFTMSGDGQGSCGQVRDSIEPANKEQKEILRIRKQYHLKEVPSSFWEQFLGEVTRAKHIPDQTQKVITEEMATAYIDEYNIKCVALAVMLGLNEEEMGDLEVNGNTVSHYGNDYLVGNEKEMQEAHKEYIESFLDDVGFDGFNQKYVDTSVEIDDDCIIVSKSITISASERADSLNRRNGQEEYCTINGETYYAYRQ